MKRIIPIFLLIFLVSCAESDAGERIISHMSREHMQIEAEVSAIFPDRVSEYRLSYTCGDGERVVVLKPESIAGITALISDDGMSVQFEDTILETGFPSQIEISPINVLPKLKRSWSTLGASEIGTEEYEGTEAYLFISREGELEYRTWFSKDELNPLASEVFYSGQAILLVRYENVRF